jgi:hypothetical protein
MHRFDAHQISSLKNPRLRSEKDAKLAQKLGQLQPFMAVSIPTGITGQLAYFGPTWHLSRPGGGQVEDVAEEHRRRCHLAGVVPVVRAQDI